MNKMMLRAVLLAIVGCQCWPARAAPPGLDVQNGVLLKDGQPYRGIGANYFSLFSRLLKTPDDMSGFSNLTALAQARIPFVRFMCTGFWPEDQQLYLTNRPAYFAQLDRVVRCAETNGIGLIPSLFWQAALIPTLVHEHLDQLGNPQSKTIAFIQSYTTEVVTRYKDSPAIWGWEFGNEYTLKCDLPNAATHITTINSARLGTATNRTARDELKFVQVSVAFNAFAQTVRKIDPTRILISGNAIPRKSAWHNVHENKFTADTVAQFNEILRRDNPDPLDTICIHLYPNEKDYPGGTTSFQAAVALTQKLARQAGKPLFIGEFGVKRQAGSREEQEAIFAEMLGAIEQEHVPLAAFWVFDRAKENQDKEYNVTFSNDRAWMLDLVRQANMRLQKE